MEKYCHEYLRPSLSVLDKPIQPSDKFTRVETIEGEHKLVRINFGPPYSEGEKDAMKQLELSIGRMGGVLPAWITRAELLRQFYAAEEDIDETVSKIGKYMAWVDLVYRKDLSLRSKTLLNKHALFITGFDPKNRPVVCMDLTYIETEQGIWLDAFIYLILLLREYCHIPNYIEGNILLVELKGKALGEVSFILKAILELAESHLFGMIQEFYFLHASASIANNVSTLLSYSHPLMQSIIHFISTEDDEKLLADKIGRETLPRTFSTKGNYKHMDQFYSWPPLYVGQVQTPVTIAELKKRNIQPYCLNTHKYLSEILYFDESDTVNRELAKDKAMKKMVHHPNERSSRGSEAIKRKEPKGLLDSLLSMFDCCSSNDQNNFSAQNPLGK